MLRRNLGSTYTQQGEGEGGGRAREMERRPRDRREVVEEGERARREGVWWRRGVSARKKEGGELKGDRGERQRQEGEWIGRKGGRRGNNKKNVNIG